MFEVLGRPSGSASKQESTGLGKLRTQQWNVSDETVDTRLFKLRNLRSLRLLCVLFTDHRVKPNGLGAVRDSVHEADVVPARLVLYDR